MSKTTHEPFAFGWHFRSSTGQLSHDRRTPKIGQRLLALTKRRLPVKRLAYCSAGMHALPRPDADYRHYGPTLSFVMVEDVIRWSHDKAKFAGRARTILWEVDCSTCPRTDTAGIEAWVRAQGFDLRKMKVKGYRIRHRLGRLPKVK